MLQVGQLSSELRPLVVISVHQLRHEHGQRADPANAVGQTGFLVKCARPGIRKLSVPARKQLS
jgi:hypothetical protein